MAQDVHDLMVWQKAIDLTESIYKLTRSFPADELYGISAQMRRASVSVASNIAEGRGRLNPAEFRQFLGVAQDSIFELKTQLLVARKLEMAATKPALNRRLWLRKFQRCSTLSSRSCNQQEKAESS